VTARPNVTMIAALVPVCGAGNTLPLILPDLSNGKKAAKAAKVDVPIYLDGVGSSQALSTVMLRTRVDGQLVKLSFKEGQDVHEGELLAVIDPRPYEVQLAQAQYKKLRKHWKLRAPPRQ